MRIASWNVNSAKARQDHILDFLKAGMTDVLLIQETKTQDPNFPETLYTDIGWNVVFHGQKSYNGVAIASRPHHQGRRSQAETAAAAATHRLLEFAAKR